MPSLEKVLLFILVIGGMLSIIPLAVWAGSGSLRAAWEATKVYCMIVGAIFAAGFVLAGFILLASIA